MAEVLALQPDALVVPLLQEEARSLGDRVRLLQRQEELEQALREVPDVELLVVGTGAADPIGAAQQAFRAAARLPVLLLSAPGEHEGLMRRLAVTPFISADVRCIPAREDRRLREALGHAVQRARQRRQLREVMGAANAQLAAAAPHPLPAPAAEMLDRLLQLAPVGVIATNLTGVVRACNARAAALLATPPEQLTGLALQQLVPEAARAQLEEVLGRAALHSGVSVMGTLRLPAPAVRAGGGERQVELSVVRLTGHGAESGYLLVLQDATERLNLLADLREAVRMRDEFVAVAAHELGTPLTALKLQVQRLHGLGARGPVGPDVLAERAGQLERIVQRLARLVDELLDVSRITSGRLELRPEPMDLRKLAEGVLEQLGGQAAQAGCPLRLSGPDSLPGRWDPMRLEQVLVNLVSNALKFSAGQPVEVELSSSPGQARLVVRDHGPGIPAAEQQRIFERFERAVSTRHHGGLGLGLWITRQIVQAHGGQVRVDSLPGQGAAFLVTLPREEPAAQGLARGASGSG